MESEHTESKYDFMRLCARMWLDEIVHDAFSPRAPDQLKRDLVTILMWMGVKHPDQIDELLKIRWVDAFVEYLKEGQSPSTGLKTAFGFFKQDKTRVSSMLTVEIRAVMKRLLATDQQIEEAARTKPGP